MTDDIVFEHIHLIDSTNDELVRRVASGSLSAVRCLSAGAQTAGRGRNGRLWLNTEGSLIMSICFPLKDIECDRWPLLSLAAALGTQDALLEFLPVAIKWPNDIIVLEKNGESKKLCGILSQIATDPTGANYVIIGIGINVNCTSVPEGLLQPATSLYMELMREIELETLKRNVATCVVFRLNEVVNVNGNIVQIYSERCALLGKQVFAADPVGNVIAEGVARRIENDGRLVIETEAGETIISAADVSLRIMQTLS